MELKTILEVLTEHFYKINIDVSFKSTQMIALLSLLNAEETEKFIAEKAAEGKRVADMTIKQLRKEIAEYKKQLDAAHEDFQQSLFDLTEKNKTVFDEQEQKFQRDIDGLNEQIADLEQELKNRPTVVPEDYQQTKDELTKAQIELGKAQANAVHQVEEIKYQSEKLQSDFAKQKSELQNNLDAANKKIDKLTKEKARSETIQKQLYDLNQRGLKNPDELFDVIVTTWGKQDTAPLTLTDVGALILIPKLVLKNGFTKDTYVGAKKIIYL